MEPERVHDHYEESTEITEMRFSPDPVLPFKPIDLIGRWWYFSVDGSRGRKVKEHEIAAD